MAFGTACGARFGADRAGLIAAALVAVNPQLIFYSQEARSCPLLALVATLSFWAFLIARRDSGDARSLTVWCLASAAALLTVLFRCFWWWCPRRSGCTRSGARDCRWRLLPAAWPPWAPHLSGWP